LGVYRPQRAQEGLAMMETLGVRQQDLLHLLLENKAGLTVEEISQALQITRNAIRQHLAGMERDGLVAPSITRPTGGRPEQLYVLGTKGRELFPRQYSWFAQVLIKSICGEAGRDGLSTRLAGIGERIARQLRMQNPLPEYLAQRVASLAELMTNLGYHARASAATDKAPAIEANNCVFHHLAAQFPEVCQFDLALLATYVGSNVEHDECMVRGGQVCRFRFKPER
jgi:predicted ArsR family transcriptional regulator